MNKARELSKQTVPRTIGWQENKKKSLHAPQAASTAVLLPSEAGTRLCFLGPVAPSVPAHDHTVPMPGAPSAAQHLLVGQVSSQAGLRAALLLSCLRRSLGPQNCLTPLLCPSPCHPTGLGCFHHHYCHERICRHHRACSPLESCGTCRAGAFSLRPSGPL